jgi:hypothetical protein
VTVLGASGDFNGFNFFNGILFAGYGGGPTTVWTSGTFSVTNSVFNSEDSGTWIDAVVGVTATVCRNTVTDTSDEGFGDAYNSKITFCGNRISGEKVWAGAYTEPNAGTDVAGYKTRAVKSSISIFCTTQATSRTTTH